MSVDLDDQLAAYGSWLRETCGADLSPPVCPAGESDTDVGSDTRVGNDLRADRHLDLRRRWLQVAAVLLVVVGIGGLAIAQRDAEPPPAAAQYTSPVDPTAHLFVLPTEPQGLELSSGGAYTAQPVPGNAALQESAGIVTGIKDDDGFSNLVEIRVMDSFPEAFAVEGSSEIDTPTGPAIVADATLPFQRIAQQRGDRWLLLTSSSVNQDLTEVLGAVEIVAAGPLTIRDVERAIIETFGQDLTAVDYSTYYEVTDPASGITFVVETATFPSAIALGAYTTNTATPTTVNGTPAWIMTRDGDPPGGVNAAVVWRATPNRIIAISAHTQADVVSAMAERLQQVTDEAWFAALPGATTED